MAGPDLKLSMDIQWLEWGQVMAIINAARAIFNASPGSPDPNFKTLGVALSEWDKTRPPQLEKDLSQVVSNGVLDTPKLARDFLDSTKFGDQRITHFETASGRHNFSDLTDTQAIDFAKLLNDAGKAIVAPAKAIPGAVDSAIAPGKG